MSAYSGRSLAEVGEFGLIEAFTAGLRQGPGVLLGPGDDAALVAAADGRVVISTDTLVQDRHFRLDAISALDLGRKAAAVTIADVAAMGARPTGLVLSCCLPADTDVDWVLDLIGGVDAECAAAGAGLVGGDVVRGDRVVLTVTVLGDLRGREPVTRSGARPGDVVAVAGALGRSAAGLAVQEHGIGADWPDLLLAHHRPHPPYAAGPEAAGLGATSLIDVSDGLLADLGHVAAASGVAIDLRSAALLPDARLAAGRPGARCRRAGLDAHRRGGPRPGRHLPARGAPPVDLAGGRDGRCRTGNGHRGRPSVVRPRLGWDHFAGSDRLRRSGWI